MALKDGYLYDLTPAELIAWVAQVTLATISEMTTQELIRIGWYNNPVVDILYSMTSAGVWIARTDSAGRPNIIEANSSWLSYASAGSANSATVNERNTGSPTVQKYAMRRIGSVSFVSNAGGSIDTDPELVPALAGYFGVCQLIAIVCDDATTPVFEVQEGTTGLANNQSPGVLVANVNKAFDENYLWGGTDNAALSIDGSDCSDLGNAKNYTIYFEYWYET